jgi:hypothetical protein
MARDDLGIDVVAVKCTIAGEGRHKTFNLVEQGANLRAIVGILVGQFRRDDGRMGWQRASGYTWRALVKADIARWKCVIGDGLRSRTNRRQTTEVAIAAEVLNRMLDLGRPAYVRIA